MARQRGHIDLSFAASVDLSSEPLMVPPDRLLRSRDVVHDVGGVPRMRPARVEGANPEFPTGVEVHDAGDPTVNAMFARGTEVCAVGKGGIRVWDGSSWVRPGEDPGFGGAALPLHNVDYYQFTLSGPGTVRHSESCIVGGRYLMTAYIPAYYDGSGGLSVRVRVHDMDEDRTIRDALVGQGIETLPHGGTLAICETSSTVAAVFWVKDGTTEIYRSVLTMFSGAVTVGSPSLLNASYPIATGYGFRASPGPTNVAYLAYRTTTTNTVQVFRVNSAGYAQVYNTTHAGTSGFSPDLDWDQQNSLLHVAVATYASSNVGLWTLTSTLGVSASTTSAFPAGVWKQTMVAACNGNVFVGAVTDPAAYSGARYKLFDSSHALKAESDYYAMFIPTGLAGEVDGMPVFAAAWPDDQPASVSALLTIAIDDGDLFLVPCGRFGNDAQRQVSTSSSYASKIRSAHHAGSRALAAHSYNAQGIGWDTECNALVLWSGSPTTTSATTDAVAYVGGPQLTVYDGFAHRENDWAVARPFNVYINQFGVSGLGEDLHAVEPGVWSFRVLMCWVDASGRLHRSSPSGAETHNFASSDAVRVEVNYPFGTSFVDNDLGRFQGILSASVMFFEIYAKAPSDSTHKLMSNGSGVTALIPESMSGLLGVFTDLHYDPTGAIIYTEPDDAGELPAEPTPPVHDMEVIGERLWLLSAERRNQLWPSKLLSPGIAYEFNAALVQTVPGEPLQAVSQINGLPLLLRRSGLSVIYGDGPNNAGVGGEWTPARSVSGAPGCVSKETVVKVPQGVVYQSDRGFFLLAPDLSVQPISGPALDRHIQDLTFTSATYSEKDHRVVFWVDGSGGDECLCWDTQSGAWSTWQTGRNTLCAVQLPNGTVCVLDQDGTDIDFSTFTTGTYTTETGLNPKWRTAWLQPAGIHGEVEWEAIVLSLRYVGPHHLKVSAYGDGDDSSAVATATLTDPDAERRGDVYTVWVESIFQAAKVRRSSSIMVEIEIDRDAPSSTLTEAARLISGRVLYSTDGQTFRRQVTSAGRM